MHKRDVTDMRALELKVRGLAIEDSLIGTAEALSRQVGGQPQPVRRPRDAGQFPFELAIAQQVRSIEVRYGELLDAAPDAIAVADAAGLVVYINAEAERRFGFSRADIVGRPLDSIIAEGVAVSSDPAGSAETGPAPAAVEVSCRRSDGSQFPMEATTRRHEGADGAVVTLALRDPAAHRLVEKRLRRDLARANAMLDQAPDAMLVLNRRGRIVLANRRAEKLLACPRDRLLGTPAEDHVQGALKPDDPQAGNPAPPIRSDAPIRGTVRRPAGEDIPVEVTSCVTEGDHPGFTILAIRASAPVASDSGAGGMEAGLEAAILAAAPVAVLGVAGDGDIVYANAGAAAQFGFAREDLVGLQIRRLVPDGFVERMAPGALPSAELTLARELGTGIELVATRRDGTRFPAEVCFASLASGDVVAATIRDMSLLRAAERHPRDGGAAIPRREDAERRVRELTRTNENLRQFARVAAHHLRDPLLRLERAVRSLDAHAGAPAAAELAHMQALLGDLTIHGELGAPRLARFPLQEALDDATAGLAARIADSGMIVTSGPLPDLSADRAQITMLFEQVIANAIAFRGTLPPRVNVTAEVNQAGEWVLSIADNGIGIERQYFERIFEMFQRLQRHEATPGTGLGLAICRRIAEQHGGRMWVESRVGLGSTFYVALPRAGAQ